MIDSTSSIIQRAAYVHKARQLEYLTIAWNSLEGILSVLAGIVAGSISLVGFGIDSFIEVTSAGTLLWRMSVDAEHDRRDQHEWLALHVVYGCFIGLAIYITADSVKTLVSHKAPEHSVLGILIAIASLVVMPMLSRAKRRVAAALSSVALKADSRQTDFCACLSAILLVGLGANWLLGWWWADPIAALLMVPIVAKEGVEGLRAKNCTCG